MKKILVVLMILVAVIAATAYHYSSMAMPIETYEEAAPTIKVTGFRTWHCSEWKKVGKYNHMKEEVYVENDNDVYATIWVYVWERGQLTKGWDYYEHFDYAKDFVIQMKDGKGYWAENVTDLKEFLGRMIAEDRIREIQYVDVFYDDANEL